VSFVVRDLERDGWSGAAKLAYRYREVIRWAPRRPTSARHGGRIVRRERLPRGPALPDAGRGRLV